MIKAWASGERLSIEDLKLLEEYIQRKELAVKNLNSNPAYLEQAKEFLKWVRLNESD